MFFSRSKFHSLLTFVPVLFFQVQLLHKLSIHAADGPQKLLKVQQNNFFQLRKLSLHKRLVKSNFRLKIRNDWKYVCIRRLSSEGLQQITIHEIP